MKPRISRVTVGVRDLAAAIRFLRKGAGFCPRRVSASNRILFVKRHLAWFIGARCTGQRYLGFEGFTLTDNVESEKAANEVVSQAVGAEATLVKKPETVFWGGNNGYLKDRYGHLGEVAHNPWLGRPER